MQSVEPVLENAIKTLQKVVDVRGMGKKWARSEPPPSVMLDKLSTNKLNIIFKKLLAKIHFIINFVSLILKINE